MDVDELIEYRASATMPRGVGQTPDWYTLASWPRSRDLDSRLMLALHRSTGEFHIDWGEIEQAAADVTNQARHLAQALLAVRDQLSSGRPAPVHLQSESRTR
jgi:hypothetical protein